MKALQTLLHRLRKLATATSNSGRHSMLILGLGNPGPGYRSTRHNVGFEAVERICTVRRMTLRRPFFRNFISAADDELVLAQPLTYMNRSGDALAYLQRRYRLTAEQVCVVVDNMDLPPGEIRMKTRGSDAGHNGLKSVTAALGSSEYSRIYIGVGRPAAGVSTVDHVLGHFSEADAAVVAAALGRLAEVFSVDTLPALPAVVSEVNRRRR